MNKGKYLNSVISARNICVTCKQIQVVRNFGALLFAPTEYKTAPGPPTANKPALCWFYLPVHCFWAAIVSPVICIDAFCAEQARTGYY